MSNIIEIIIKAIASLFAKKSEETASKPVEQTPVVEEPIVDTQTTVEPKIEETTEPEKMEPEQKPLDYAVRRRAAIPDKRALTESTINVILHDLSEADKVKARADIKAHEENGEFEYILETPLQLIKIENGEFFVIQNLKPKTAFVN